MKTYILLIFLATLVSCSKDSSGPVANTDSTQSEESTQAISLEAISKAKTSYESKLLAFRKASGEKLETQKLAFEDYQDKARDYLNLLRLASNNQLEVEKVTDILAEDLKAYQGIKGLLKKLNDSKIELNKAKEDLKKIKSQTNGFILSEITELGLRDQLLESTDTYRQSAQFLTLTFQNEFDQSDLDLIHITLQENDDIERIFAPYFQLKDALLNSKENLKKVDFSFDKEDHTVAGLTHTGYFFKALEDHIESIEDFQRDASIFLNIEDNKSLNQDKLKLSDTLSSLSEMRKVQNEIGSDLRKIWTLGYDLPDNIGSLKEDELKWKTKEVWVAETLPMKGEWQIGYHIAGQRYNSTPGDLITLKNHWYKLVDKETYPVFDDAFGTAFTRIVLYLSKYEKQMPKSKSQKYNNIGDLLMQTYGIVTDYIDSL
ncbi:MAG: hypothetical protein KC478_12235 [Bacteriovoracaceae bacterium]|nr:hypothetical protein [Bacteriovoracaceae bacterium]